MTEPTDLELMMFADGELEEPRRADVAAFLEGSKDGRLKLHAMGIVGAFVQKDADRLATAFRADDIASKVMAAIESGASLSPKFSSDDANGTAKAKPAARVVKLADANYTTKKLATGKPAEKVSAEVSTAKAGEKSKAANDNNRFIYALAAFSAAAAVALGVWSRGPGPAPLPPDRVAHANTDAPADSALPPLASEREVVASVTPAPVETHGVEVARVNWGENKPGAVYYVDSDNRGSMTTVVWIASE